MKKKLFSLIMAVAMVMSLALPAMATETVTGAGQQTKAVTMTGDMALPSVKVTLPTSGKAILNPYKLKVSVSGDSTTAVTSGDSIDDQVLSASHKIENKTLAPLKIGIKVKATPSSGVEMATAACTGQETTKSVFMFAEMLYGGTSEPAVDKVAKEWTEAAKVNETYYPQIIVSTTEKENANFFTAPAAASDTAPNYIYWTLRGNAALAPTNKWTATDKVDTTVTFSFTPDVLTYAAYTSDNTDNVATLQVGKGMAGSGFGTTAANGNLDMALKLKDAGGSTAYSFTPDGAATPLQAVTGASMGSVVRIVAKSKSNSEGTDGVISAVEVKDTFDNTRVTATRVSSSLFYFTMPAPGHNVTVKITGTPAT